MLKNTFCSSPWFHLRLTYDGQYEECRWFKNSARGPSVATESVMEFYNSNRMQQLRTDLLNGKTPAGCETCYYEDSFDKLNGRKRQLLKSGIRVEDFERSLRSSLHYDYFKYSLENNGQSIYSPTDLQIDLGNTCNSSCIMCHPSASSRLAQDYKKLNQIEPELFNRPQDFSPWTRDPATVDRLFKQLGNIKDIKYIHLLGGETLYDPAFYQLCEELVKSGQAENIIVGTTTNGTIYDSRIEKLIPAFKEFHLGISIESVTALNDYIRWPGRIDSILSNIDKFLELRKNSKLYISLRITPNVFSVSELDQLFEYMIEHNVIAESCNILYNPKHLRIELLPDDIRQQTIEKFESIIKRYQLSRTDHVNIRKLDIIPDVIANVILDYYQFLTTYTVPEDADDSRRQLVKFIKAFEQLRSNSILDYLPNYEKFLRNYGY